MRINRSARYILPETIVIGDVIRATIKNKDVEISSVGVVARREHTQSGTEYISPDGVTLLETYRFDDRKVRVTLLDRPADRAQTLPGMEI
jgi:hypothetical protein